MANKTKITIIEGEQGAIAYFEANTIKACWELVHRSLKLRLDVVYTASVTVERTRRMDGSKFRFNDPCNPNNYTASNTKRDFVKRYTEARDFTTEIVFC